MTTTRKRTATQHRLAGYLVIVMGLVLTVAGSWGIWQDVEYTVYGVVTEGQVIAITSGGSGIRYKRARVRYVIDGHEMSATTEDRFRFATYRVGETLHISYLSTNPARIRTAVNAGKIGGELWLLILGFVLGGSGLLWWMQARRWAKMG